MVKNALLGTNDIPYIIKAGIYLDNFILDLLFKDKIKLLSFLILNDYPDDYVQKVKEMYNFEEEKNNLNNETEEILSKNINIKKEKTLNLSSKKKN